MRNSYKISLSSVRYFNEVILKTNKALLPIFIVCKDTKKKRYNKMIISILDYMMLTNDKRLTEVKKTLLKQICQEKRIKKRK